MAYTIEWDPHADRALRKLPENTQRRIVADVESALSTDPHPYGSTKLRGRTDTYRLRVGDFRVIYQVRSRELIVLVVDVGPRKSVYKDQ